MATLIKGSLLMASQKDRERTTLLAVAAIKVLSLVGSLVVKVSENTPTVIVMKESSRAVSLLVRVLIHLPMVVSIKAG